MGVILKGALWITTEAGLNAPSISISISKGFTALSTQKDHLSAKTFLKLFHLLLFHLFLFSTLKNLQDN